MHHDKCACPFYAKMFLCLQFLNSQVSVHIVEDNDCEELRVQTASPDPSCSGAQPLTAATDTRTLSARASKRKFSGDDVIQSLQSYNATNENVVTLARTSNKGAFGDYVMELLDELPRQDMRRDCELFILQAIKRFKDGQSPSLPDKNENV